MEMAKYQKRVLSFFTVYLPHLNSKRLELPIAFILKLKSYGDVPSNALLKNTLGMVWRVELEEMKDRFSFYNGWEKFVQDHSLQLGEFVVFGYEGNSVFTFNVFGHSQVRKKDVKTTCFLPVKHELEMERTRERDVTSAHVKAEFIRKPTVTINNPVGKRFFEVSGTQMTYPFNSSYVGEPHHSKIILMPKTREAEEDDGVEICDPMPKQRRIPTTAIKNSLCASSTEQAGSLRTKNPSFKIVMGQAYVENRYVYIPKKFSKNLPKNLEGVKLVAPNGQIHFVEIYDSGIGGIRITRGWSEFASRMGLKSGTVCLFELMKEGDFMLKVHILPKN
ncbi:hypothetical protein GIB67_007074 [Kingdonia uniflora]|uniref:TF-B3 domain-containing protein n=1 Tax=Kingdonia uniflora TaxID=39325 RepID=A0A7J7NZE6_9MAGN|nr:hypothetical protein GIB67_007074 [Kingdonia uniflora]